MTVDNCALLHAVMNGYSDEGGGIHPRKFYRALHMKVMENM